MYSKLPTFNFEKWTKTGMFVDTTLVDHLLSKIAKDKNREMEGKVSAKTINEFYELKTKPEDALLRAMAGTG